MTNNYSNITNTTPNLAGQSVYQPQQQCPTAIPSANGVNIVIYNPQVTPGANVSNINNYPNNLPQAYPQNYYTTQPAQNNGLNNNNGQSGENSQSAKSVVAAATLTTQTPEAPKEDEKETKLKTKQVVQLTDEYIKTLESYLDNQDYKVRQMGVKELLYRFEEDDTRKADPALTALLNKALQDPNDSIRFLAMSTINAGYATGNDLTHQLVAKIGAENKAYGEDGILASEIRLNSAETKVQIADKQENTANTGGNK